MTSDRAEERTIVEEWNSVKPLEVAMQSATEESRKDADVLQALLLEVKAALEAALWAPCTPVFLKPADQSAVGLYCADGAVSPHADGGECSHNHKKVD